MDNKGFQNQRKNYFIKREFQTKFILKFCLLICLGSVLMAALVYTLSTRTITTSFENLRLVSKSTADFILPALTLSSLIAGIIISMACIVIVLFISHRIAGPLYRLERSIEEVARCDLTVNTRLRRTDELKRLAECLNTMVEKLREAVVVSKEAAEELKNNINAIKGRLTQCGMPKDDIERMLGSCEARVRELDEALSYFKVR